MLHMGGNPFPGENIFQPDYTSDSDPLELQLKASEIFAKFHALSCQLLYFPAAISKGWPFESVFIIIFQGERPF